MADRTLQQVKALYGEILGIADHLPTSLLNPSVIELYNGAVDELSKVSNSDYSRFEATHADISRNFKNTVYRVDTVKPKMGALLSRLEQEFDLHKPSRGEQLSSPTIVTINNNNQFSVTIVPIQEVLQSITDVDLCADVEALKEVIQGDKDKHKASSLLNRIQQKSWDVFIALLPIVLEQLGRSNSGH
jgi:hypothetical protein